MSAKKTYQLSSSYSGYLSESFQLYATLMNDRMTRYVLYVLYCHSFVGRKRERAFIRPRAQHATLDERSRKSVGTSVELVALFSFVVRGRARKPLSLLPTDDHADVGRA